MTSPFNQMTFDEIREFISPMKSVPYRGKTKDLLPRVIELTSFLDDIHDRIPNSVRTYCIVHGIDSIEKHPKCGNPDCQKPVSIGSGNKGFTKSCSKECMFVVRVSTHESNFYEKHGVKNPMQLSSSDEKRRETYKQRFGADHPMQSNEVKTKRKETLLETTGIDSTFGNPMVREKSEATMREKWGVLNASHSQELVEKRKKSWRGTWESSKEEIIEKRNSTMRANRKGLSDTDDREFLEFHYIESEMSMQAIADLCDVSLQTVSNRINTHEIPVRTSHSTSYEEKEINEFVKSLGLDTIANDKSVLNGKEIDVYIPSLNLGIEFDGIYWHSTQHIKTATYHRDKTDLAESKGIRLIHIFENEWMYKKDIVLKKIKNICGVVDERIYARKTQVMEISNKRSRAFYDQNHIQGFGTPATKVYGLFSEDMNLVACMSFQQKKDNEWELTRFATSCSVVGGFSKLLKKFIRENDPKSIISFADRRWSQGDVYIKNGFSEDGRTRPNYYYIKNKQLVRKENFRHSRMAKNLENYDPTLSEKENTEAHGIYRIYDCGMIKYRMEL